MRAEVAAVGVSVMPIVELCSIRIGQTDPMQPRPTKTVSAVMLAAILGSPHDPDDPQQDVLLRKL